jgi:hypothetical protein
MSVEKFTDLKLSAEEAKKYLIQNLRLRPNNAGYYGEKGMNGNELRKKFDEYPEALRQKLGNLIDAIVALYTSRGESGSPVTEDIVLYHKNGKDVTLAMLAEAIFDNDLDRLTEIEPTDGTVTEAKLSEDLLNKLNKAIENASQANAKADGAKNTAEGASKTADNAALDASKALLDAKAAKNKAEEALSYFGQFHPTKRIVPAFCAAKNPYMRDGYKPPFSMDGSAPYDEQNENQDWVYYALDETLQECFYGENNPSVHCIVKASSEEAYLYYRYASSRLIGTEKTLVTPIYYGGGPYGWVFPVIVCPAGTTVTIETCQIDLESNSEYYITDVITEDSYLSVAFPYSASDVSHVGESITFNFATGDTAHLVIDTTNTTDLDFTPSPNSVVEINGKYCIIGAEDGAPKYGWNLIVREVEAS